MARTATKTNVVAFPGTKAKPRTAPRARAASNDTTVNFTDAQIKTWCRDSLTEPGRKEWKDSAQRKLCVRVQNGVASFSIYTRVKGYATPQRVTLGTNAELNVKAAREAARLELAKLGAGVRVNQEKATLRTLSGKLNRTVSDLLEQYLAEKTWDGAPLTDTTRSKYRYDLRAMLGRAFDEPIGQLTGADVSRLYRERCRKVVRADSRGVMHKAGSASSAKTAVDALAAVCNFHDIESPTAEIYRAKQVANIGVRRARIGVATCADLLAWALDRVEKPRAGDPVAFRDQCFMLCLSITMGLRIKSVRMLRWEWLDLRRGTVTFPPGVLKSQRDYVLPVPELMRSLLAARRKLQNDGSPFVFAQVRNPNVPAHFTSDFAKCLPLQCGPHDGRKVFGLTVARVQSNVIALPLLMTHSPKDVTMRHYVEAHSWEELLQDMRPASDAAAAALLAKRNNRAAIKAMEVLHVERYRAQRDRFNELHRARRAKATAIRQAARARLNS